MKTAAKVKWGAYLGSTIGILGWLIGFSIFCLATGNRALLGEAFLPGLLISLIFAAVVVFVLETVIQRFGAGHWLFQVSLWGLLLSLMGLMVFLMNHWLAPLIDRHPDMVKTLSRMGSVYKTSDVVPLALMAAGLLLLVVAVVYILKQAPPE